ncbi:hypothetical protein ACFY30_19710 [Streptomyces sp. NPDC000345]|uniref:hypothetical protein n=1 Tax=Streptomyces sp. NPDC000345 TaxID=3364537 RepID=UPI0036A2C35C
MTTPHDHRPAPGETADPVPLERTRVEDQDDYSATVLGSHWIQRPDDDTAALSPHGDQAPTALGPPGDQAATVVSPDGDPATTALGPRTCDGTTPVRPGDGPPAPGPGDGTVLRFGPGVTAARGLTAALPSGTHTVPHVPAAPAPAGHRRLRRHALPALVLIAALVFLLWRDAAPGLSVREVTVAAAQDSTGCDGTADVVGVVRTDGRAGELSYRWVRNDGTASDVLHATVAEGRRVVRLHLLWTFQGQGSYAAAAELRVLSPGGGTARTAFTYDCS